jgi:hypothetical protein
MAVAQEQRFDAGTTALATKRDEHRLAAVARGGLVRRRLLRTLQISFLSHI